jgi:hypothetical protein
LAYEFELPDSFEPWPGRTLLERTFVLLDLGVSFANPCWARHVKPDGSVVDRAAEGSDTWYVDLVTVEQHEDRYIFRDLYIDVVVPMDGRHYRMLDLDEFADAIEAEPGQETDWRLSDQITESGSEQRARHTRRPGEAGHGPRLVELATIRSIACAIAGCCIGPTCKTPLRSAFNRNLRNACVRKTEGYRAAPPW